MEEVVQEVPMIVELITDYGFPVVMMVGLGYFVYFVWNFISEHIDPEIEKMHFALIRVIDQTRMLDQDMIRLQQKVDVVLEYRARQEVLEDAEKEKAFEKQKKTTKG